MTVTLTIAAEKADNIVLRLKLEWNGCAKFFA
jgi:hypothetical protein